MVQICATMVHLKGNNVQIKFVLVTRTHLFKPIIPPGRGSVLGDTFQLMRERETRGKTGLLCFHFGDCK